MEVCGTNLDDVWIVKPDVSEDFRGQHFMIYQKGVYKRFNSKLTSEINYLDSYKGVMNGIHYSPDCWKIYQCLVGVMYYVFIDMETFQWESFIISEHNKYQLIKHPRYATGFVAVTDCKLIWFQSELYNPDNPNQQTFKWTDERFNLWWPKITETPLLSRRDEIGHYINKEG